VQTVGGPPFRLSCRTNDSRTPTSPCAQVIAGNTSVSHISHVGSQVFRCQMNECSCLDRPVQDSPGGKARDGGIFHFSAFLVPLLTEYVSRMSKNGITDSSMIGIVPAVPGLP